MKDTLDDLAIFGGPRQFSRTCMLVAQTSVIDISYLTTSTICWTEGG